MQDENTDTYKRSPTSTPGGLRKEGLSGGEGKADQRYMPMVFPLWLLLPASKWLLQLFSGISARIKPLCVNSIPVWSSENVQWALCAREHIIGSLMKSLLRPLAISVHSSNEISECVKTRTTGIIVLEGLEGEGVSLSEAHEL